MVDFNKLDVFFADDSFRKNNKHNKKIIRRTRTIRIIKLTLPMVAAALAGLLIVLPSLQSREDEFQINIPKPKAGELEKLHMENTVFYMTDKNNLVNNFTAETIDETSPGSKLVKLINPEGLLPTSESKWLSIKSPIGYYDQNQNLLWLDENVSMVYSDGMKAQTKRIYYDGKTAQAYSKTPVTANGYFGNLKSEGFEYYKDKDLIIFTGKSKIVIHQDKTQGSK